MEFEDPRAAGIVVVTVDILGDDQDTGSFLKVGKGLVGRVEPGAGDQATAPIVPPPDQFGIAGKGLGSGKFLGTVPAPEAVLLAAESGDAAGGGNSRSGQGGDPGRRGDGRSDAIQFPADRFFQSHDYSSLARAGVPFSGPFHPPMVYFDDTP